MPKLTGRINGPLTNRLVSSQTTFSDGGAGYHFSIGGVPFLSAINNQRPYQRETANFRRDQFDNSKDPGEQSLTGWWLRSQSSFHLGTGINFEDPAQSEDLSNRFRDSAGVNVFVPGQVTMLRRTASVDVTATSWVQAITTGPNDYHMAQGVTVKKHVVTSTSTTPTITTYTWGGTGTVLSMTHDGTDVLVADATGIYKNNALQWNTGNSNVVIGWAHQRLVAGIGPSIYELVGTGPALPTAKYTHPTSGWKWTCITDTPKAIFIGGYGAGGVESVIVKLELNSSGVMPTLTSAIVAAELPKGETVQSLYTVLGRYIAIGTNKGIRIGALDDQGNITYGPLNVETTEPVYAITGYDRFVFFTLGNGQIGGISGIGRIDLGSPVADGRFAWATDLRANGSETASIQVLCRVGTQNRLVFAVNGSFPYLEHHNELENLNSFLLTGRIRYNVLEPKNFKRLRVLGDISNGSIVAGILDQNEAETSLYTLSGASSSFTEIQILTPGVSQAYVSFRFTFARGTTPSLGPTLKGYQLKALPAARRQRQFTLPLLCFDFESNAQGDQLGTDGWGLKRLEALEEIEGAGDAVSYQDLTRDITKLVVIDNLKFVSMETPHKVSWPGGYLYVTLRTID